MTTPDIEQPESAADGLHDTAPTLSKQAVALIETIEKVIDNYSVHQAHGYPKGTVARRAMKKRMRKAVQHHLKGSDLRLDDPEATTPATNTSPQSPTSKGELDELRDILNCTCSFNESYNGKSWNNKTQQYEVCGCVTDIEQLQAYIDKYYIRRGE